MEEALTGCVSRTGWADGKGSIGALPGKGSIGALPGKGGIGVLPGKGTCSLEQTADMTPELASRIRRYVLSPGTFEERVSRLKSRQLTYTRVSRALLHLLLRMPEAETLRFKENGYAPYARILGFRKESAPLLSVLKQNSRIPLVTKLADAPSLLKPEALAMLNREIAASHLYQMAAAEKGGVFKNEYTQPIVIL